MNAARALLLAFALLLLATSALAAPDAPRPLKIGSKRFTESYILAEILRDTAAPVTQVELKRGLGNTAIVFGALQAGEVDLYPEYIGTIEREILHHSSAVPVELMRRELAARGLGLGIRFGFSDGYALAMNEDQAAGLGIRTISEFASHADLRLGLSHEFLGRADGWKGLAARYGLHNRTIGLDHGLAYQALANRKVDAIDIYSTDARIEALHLRVLKDDLQFFPRYDAVLLYRLDVPQRFPRAWERIRALEGRISEESMIRMNAAAELKGEAFASIARAFLGVETQPAPGRDFRDLLFGPDFWRLARQHLLLVAVSVALASAIGVPLGVLAATLPGLGRLVVNAVGLLQTIPSLALLAMLIPVLGTIGALPAIVALFLYALLPIVGNTVAGLMQVPAGLRQASLALGLSFRDRMLCIDLPLSLPMILAGIRTATVINVGTATIAAFIGAGGFGERIATGLALNDNRMLLAGALPAAALAILAQLLFDAIERWYGLRHGSSGGSGSKVTRSRSQIG